MNSTHDTVRIDPQVFSDLASDQRPTAPSEMLLLRFGSTTFTHSAPGRPQTRSFFQFAAEDAQSIMDDWAQRGKDIVIDYGHEAVHSPAAIAAGWISRLFVTDEGLMAAVTWTDKARTHLEAREYRYHSPALHLNNGRPVRLHSVALTNIPAMHGYPALVADESNSHTQEAHMDTDEQRVIPEDGTPAVIALADITGKLGIELVTLSDGGVDEEGTKTAILSRIEQLADHEQATMTLLSDNECTTLADLAAKISGMVPLSEKQALQDTLDGITADQSVAKAFSEGKLTEGQRKWAASFARRDPQGFAEFASAAPVVVPGTIPQTLTGPSATVEDATLSLSESEKMIFKKIGLTDTQIKALYNHKED